MLLLVYYIAHNVMHAYITRMLLTNIFGNFSSDLHASVKFKLSYAVALLYGLGSTHILSLWDLGFSILTTAFTYSVRGLVNSFANFHLLHFVKYGCLTLS